MTRRGWLLTGLAGAVALMASAGPLTAGASVPSGWRIVATVGSSSSIVGDGSIVVTGAADAWTTWTCGPCPAKSEPHENLMVRWNGKRWSPVELPSELRYPAVISGLQASSARNLWVFADGGRLAVFNGSSWASKHLPSWVERPIEGDDSAVASAVFSPANAWAFSLDAASEPTLAGHYLNGSWHKVNLPVIPSSADGLAPDDIWLYGFAKNFGPRTLAHWNGSSWRTVSFPHVASGATLVPSTPVALGPKSIWLTGEVFGPKAGKVTFELLHWNGRWKTVSIPASVGIANQMASDGHGGFWLITTHVGAGGATESRFTHYAGGHWDSLPIPTQGKLSSDPGVLASVPGSRSMWAIGFLVNGSTPEFGDIMGFGG